MGVCAVGSTFSLACALLFLRLPLGSVAVSGMGKKCVPERDSHVTMHRQFRAMLVHPDTNVTIFPKVGRDAGLDPIVEVKVVEMERKLRLPTLCLRRWVGEW